MLLSVDDYIGNSNGISSAGKSYRISVSFLLPLSLLKFYLKCIVYFLDHVLSLVMRY